jgi:hypothetical protein
MSCKSGDPMSVINDSFARSVIQARANVPGLCAIDAVRPTTSGALPREEIRALDVDGAHMLWIGIADDPPFTRKPMGLARLSEFHPAESEKLVPWRANERSR